MKTIIIKSMHIVNFKGVRDLEITFDAHITDIAGRNGSGKTTVFDAFTWLLFGCDSQNRKDFDIKTLDTDGKIIYHLPHEVSATINVDGTDITLCRRIIEKFPKQNGVPTFNGNTIERFVDDVPCKEKEYDAKIAEICDYDTFKKITSPTYFVSQPDKKQKADLLMMAGEINDADIAAGNPEFEMLLDRKGDKTFDEFSREIGAKHKRIKTEIAGIPDKIDEKERDIARHTDDWAAIESEITIVTAERDDVDAELLNIDAAAQRINDARMKIAGEISSKRIELSRRRDAVRDAAMKSYRERMRELQSFDADLQNAKMNVARIADTIDAERANVTMYDARRREMLVAYKQLNARLTAVQNETITFNDDDFVCPTCHRPLEVDNIAARQTEMTTRFESERQKRVDAVKREIADNMSAGQRNTALLNAAKQRITELESQLTAGRERVDEMHSQRMTMNDVTAPDVEPIIAADADVIRITGEIAELESQQSASTPEPATNNAELKSRRAELNKRLDDLKSRLAIRAVQKSDEQRRAELESKYRTLTDEMNDYEHLMYVIGEFSKAKSDEIDKRIDGLFKIVRFRWIKYLINGNETETCEATINGVPYSSLNTAGRIIAGIDIINAICRFEGITAPLIIDNAESLNTIPETESQQIRLIVSDDDRLTVKSK